MQPKRSGKSGRYLRVLNPASENGLSLDTLGREWVLVVLRQLERDGQTAVVRTARLPGAHDFRHLSRVLSA